MASIKNSISGIEHSIILEDIKGEAYNTKSANQPWIKTSEISQKPSDQAHLRVATERINNPNYRQATPNGTSE